MAGVRPRSIVWPALFALAGIAILVGLGVWQVERLVWKEALIARVEERLGAPPVPAPGPGAWAGIDLAALEYTPVTVRGHYLNGSEIHVVYALTQPKGPAGGVGYLVFAPFETDSGWIVYVNRGFVPKERKEPGTRPGGIIEGDTAATGLLRQPAKTAWFMPGDNVAANAWFSRDPSAFARSAGFQPSRVAPYLIDAVFDPALPGGLPQGGETVVAFTNNHLQYAITWFGLAAALVGVFAVFAWGRRKG